MEKRKIGGILQNSNLTKIGVMSVPDRPGVAAAVFSTLGKTGINVQFIVQCIDLHDHTHIICCVAEEDTERAVAALEGVKQQVGAERVLVERGMAIVSIFGPDFREIPGIAGTMFSALAAVNINILAISTSISTLSCVIPMDRVKDAVRALGEVFELP